jgi:hypothetical protein
LQKAGARRMFEVILFPFFSKILNLHYELVLSFQPLGRMQNQWSGVRPIIVGGNHGGALKTCEDGDVRT